MFIFKGAKIGNLTIVTFLVAFAVVTCFMPKSASAQTVDSMDTMSSDYAIAGYGGGCKISVIPPSGGFKVSATPINRNWWEWWLPPQVNLSIAGGTAYQMMISDSSTFSGATKKAYATHVTWNVPNSWQQGWKTVYVKFFSTCGKPTLPISHSYYYWGW